MTPADKQDAPQVVVVEFVGGPEDGTRMTFPVRTPPPELTPPQRPPAGTTADQIGPLWTMLRYTRAKQHADGRWLYNYTGSFTADAR